VDELFSCRNCIHNSGQSLLIGAGDGFCLKHDSVLREPARTTCKYLHRKDLPRFVVDEGLREHAGEFAGFPGMADLIEHRAVPRLAYSEKLAWEQRRFDPLTRSLAHYYKTKPAWTFLEAMSGGIDGRRSLAHASLVRRYMDNCGTWKSVYRFVLALVQELPDTPVFQDKDLLGTDGNMTDALREDALWDVFFTRLSGLQEYGFHAGIESLMWSTDELNGSLVTLDWAGVQAELDIKLPRWTDLIIECAEREGEFFAPQPAAEEVG
jgi:hypothetical protein